MNRRAFLQTAGVAAGAVALAKKTARAADTAKDTGDPYGILVDTTKCEGCRTCEVVCAQGHGLPAPDQYDESVFEHARTPSTSALTVVNRVPLDGDDEDFVKRGCMHCLQPACATGCLTRAMEKTEAGPVVWNGDKCMGCRYCMVSCPFDVPRFEYHSTNPKIVKCDMCADQLAVGEKPRCVANCPEQALTFGRRSELLRIAHKRIADNPDQYVDHIYGEHEVGGTSLLYLASVPFEQLGFRTDLGTTPVPQYTKEFLYGVPIVLTVVPMVGSALEVQRR